MKFRRLRPLNNDHITEPCFIRIINWRKRVMTSIPTLLFSSYHNYLDGSSGAAITTRAVLLSLVRAGWRVRTLCGAFFDVSDDPETAFHRATQRCRLRATCELYETNYLGKTCRFKRFHFNDSGIESTFIQPIIEAEFAPQKILALSASTWSAEILVDRRTFRFLANRLYRY